MNGENAVASVTPILNFFSGAIAFRRVPKPSSIHGKLLVLRAISPGPNTRSQLQRNTMNSGICNSEPRSAIICLQHSLRLGKLACHAVIASSIQRLWPEIAATDASNTRPINGQKDGSFRFGQFESSTGCCF